MSGESEVDYEMVMPFVVCQSQGGPFEDDPFVAGFEMGVLDETLRVLALFGTVPTRLSIRSDNVPQADLIAMRHGMAAEFVETGIPGWSGMNVTRLEATP